MPEQVTAMDPRWEPSAKAVPILLLKLAVTGICFWYVVRQINVADLAPTLKMLDAKWTVFAALLILLEVPLVALRWCQIVDALRADMSPVPRRPMMAITAIGLFFNQVLPNLVGDTMRVWLFARLGRDWRDGLTSVLIDRGVAVGALLAIGFVTLFFPSALTALGGHQATAIKCFGLFLAAGTLGLATAPYSGRRLLKIKIARWVGQFAIDAHRVLLGSPAALRILSIALAVHGLTILSVWALGQAQGLAYSITDAAVLFTAMIAVSLLPVSIGGWGLREVAVVTLLRFQGAPVEQALVFSIMFGLIVIIASLPGAIVWTIYSPEPIKRSPDL
jgi:uncharacterized membrane protein YbhN (UPF0104 family)